MVIVINDYVHEWISFGKISHVLITLISSKDKKVGVCFERLVISIVVQVQMGLDKNIDVRFCRWI